MKTFLEQAGAVLAPVALSLLGYLALRVDAYFRARTALVRDERARGILVRAREIVETRVRAFEQTIKPEILAAAADGRISMAEALGLRDRVVHETKRELGAAGVAALDAATGLLTVDEHLRAETEAAVQRVKSERAAPPAAVANNVTTTILPPPLPATDPDVTPPETPAAIGAALGAATKASDR
jgi:hypothetical protein